MICHKQGWLTCATAVIFCLFFASTHLGAQGEHDAPFTRIEIDKNQVSGGEPVVVAISVLAPNWFVKAPEFTAPDVANSIVLEYGRSIPFTEEIGEITFAGLRKEYRITPLAGGTIIIPPTQITVVYAKDPPKPSDPVVVVTQQLQFESQIPDEAAGLGYFLATTDFRLSQQTDRELKDLKVGNSFQRRITMSATNLSAMYFPPPQFSEIEGLSVYSAQPVLQDTKSERGEDTESRRTDVFTYTLEKEGDFVLPAFEVSWWDVGASALRTERVPELKFTVSPGPLAVQELPPAPEQAEEASEPAVVDEQHWWKEWALPVGMLVAFFLIRWLWKRYGSAWLLRWQEYHAKRAESEEAFFQRFRSACRSGTPSDVYAALMAWMDRAYPEKTAALDEFARVVNDPGLTEQMDHLKRHLYGSDRSSGREISLMELVRAVEKARRLVLEMDRKGKRSEILLPSLNP